MSTTHIPENLKMIPTDKYETAVANIRDGLRSYIVTNKLKSLVIGVSGGIDSALVCALAKPICDELHIPLIGRSISIVTNKRDEEDRADAIGNYFCHDYEHIDLSEQYNTIAVESMPQGKNENDRSYKIRLGNIKARVRMIALYDIAQATGGLVLSTDNYTEFLLGFWTICGDIGDLSIIQQLWKTEVYRMTEHLIRSKEFGDDANIALQNCISCNATDGLGITSTDLDQILPDWRDRYTSTYEGYGEVDQMFINYFNGDKTLEDSEPVKRYHRTHFKRNWPYVFSREFVLGF